MSRRNGSGGFITYYRRLINVLRAINRQWYIMGARSEGRCDESISPPLETVISDIMITMSLKLTSYKGTRDLYPADMAERDYIFSGWRRVVRSYGYEEYMAPLLAARARTGVLAA